MTPPPRPLELARLADDEVDELVEVLEQLAPAHRGAGARSWEVGTGRRLELVDQLVLASTRQARVSVDSGGAAPPPAPTDDAEDTGDTRALRATPLPFVAAAGDTAEQLHGALASWASRTMREDAAECPVGPRRPAPRSLESRELAAWLLGRLHTLTWRPGSTREELATLGRLVRRGRGIIDRPADRWYAGPCATPLRDDAGGLVIVAGAQAYCETDLYARPHMPVVLCPDCGAKHRVENRRNELLRLAREYVHTATVVSRALTSLGTPCTAERIRQWKKRQRLDVVGIDHEGHPLYRVGDVMDLLEADAVRKTRRATKETRTA